MFSNKELDGIIKIVKSLEEVHLLIKGVSETVDNEVKEQKVGLLGMLSAILGASLLGNMLAGREMRSKIPKHKLSYLN